VPEFMQPETHSDFMSRIPRDLSILPLRNTVAFPFSVIPLTVGIARSVRLIEDVLQSEHRFIGLVAMRDSTIELPQPGEVYEVGTVALVHRAVRAPGSTSMQVMVQGMERFRIEHWLRSETYLRAHIRLAPDEQQAGLEMDALQRTLMDLAREVIALSPTIPDEAASFLDQVDDPRYLAYLVAANMRIEVEEGQRILEMDSVRDKLQALIARLSREKEVLTLGRKIQSEAREEIDKAQREYFLRQQLKAIQKELGESEDGASAIAEYTARMQRAKLPEEARREAERELSRLANIPPQSPEHSVIRSYLDWLLDLPWSVLSADQLDIGRARAILAEDHYNLQ